MQTIGERIRAARIARGLSVASLSRALPKAVSVKASSISQWEFNKTEPRREVLAAVAKILAVEITWLEYGHGQSGLELPGGIERIGREIVTLTQEELLSGKHPASAPRIRSHFDAPPTSVAMRLRSRALLPKIPPGSVLVLDQKRTPEPGNIVAANIGGTFEIGELHIMRHPKGRTLTIKPYADGWPESVVKESEIIGIATEVSLSLVE